jgi:hypothetical protein
LLYDYIIFCIFGAHKMMMQNKKHISNIFMLI